MEFKFDICSLGHIYVRCPKCGNNTCNGGYGEYDGKECNFCEKAYEFEKNIPVPQEIIQRLKKDFPEKYEELSSYKDGK